MAAKLEYTETFLQTVDSAISHFAQYYGELATIERIEQVITAFESAVTQNPTYYAVCGELVELGTTQVRQAIKGDFRILYEVLVSHHETVILVLLLLSQRQSIQHQLINHCLFLK